MAARSAPAARLAGRSLLAPRRNFEGGGGRLAGRIFPGVEQHWNGSLLDSVETILNFARSFSFQDVKPVVQLVSKTYQNGVKLTQKQMRLLEKRFQRLEGLEKWFVLITPLTGAHTV